MDQDVWQELLRFAGVILYGTLTGRAVARRFDRTDLANVALIVAVATALLLVVAQKQVATLIVNMQLPPNDTKVLALLIGALLLNVTPIAMVAIAFFGKRSKD